MSSQTPSESSSGFAGLDLPAFLLKTLSTVGYEKPSPIQQATIPALLSGRDVIGMAQTGTGKTAAFALPILTRIDVSANRTQALVLCPTRELAIQVAEAFQTYAAGLKGFHVLPVYGGQDMQRQLTGLRRGAHVVVGTPGRLLDHLRRGTLNLSALKTLVLDEADEMLRMGFIDDVEMILKSVPESRQVALFSATMPKPIRLVAEKYLKSPEEIRIENSLATNPDIEQFFWLVQGTNKLDALTRILEVENFDGMIVFVRTKTSTVELAEKLNARGFTAAPLNGDMNQAIRTRTVEQLKNGQLDILVATDVAARGLDVDRVSHVMNYDIPYDDEAYVHRIGRTGRAGRSGKAILFVAPRERRLLQSIEKTTNRKIMPMELPTRGELITRRSSAFKEIIADTIRQEKLEFFEKLVTEISTEQECSMEQVAAAMAYLIQKERPLAPSFKDTSSRDTPSEKSRKPERNNQSDPEKRESLRGKADRDEAMPRVRERKPADPTDIKAKPLRDFPEIPMERFRIHVGNNDGVTPGEIVGAIANEAEMEGKYIGHIRIHEDFCTVDLPEGMPEEVFHILYKTRVRNKPLRIESMRPGATLLAEHKPRRPPGKPEAVPVARESGKGSAPKPGKGSGKESGKEFAPKSGKESGKPRVKNRANKDKGKRRVPGSGRKPE